MLFADQFSVGPLDRAVASSLILPRSTYEYPILVGLSGGEMVAVFLDGPHRFKALRVEESSNWHGIIIPKVRVEVCTSNIVNPNMVDELGLMVRTATNLSIVAHDPIGFGRHFLVALEDGLSDAGRHGAGFRTWRVVLGEGTSKTVLWSHEAATG